ncbi:facilitated trehalose transporter Tret1-like [Achroia grisella]|uniref:facilitated trehalose transporter Tret1-like n=1 Tax=Achroia grisella TaxID=688607 RepID=UPI0027D2937E|nr:facilitated trehalose transporter Tret1-like [Achroia grisella]
MEDEKPKTKESSVPFLRQCFLTVSVCMNVMGHGCVIGFSAILIPSLRKPESHIKATVAEESWIASVIGFALIVGNVIITLILGTIGRKKTHILSALPLLIGWFILVIVNSVSGLIFARLLQGVAMGMLGPLCSIIIAEMTDPINRGAFLTGVSLSLSIGVLVSHTLGTFYTWQQCALMCSFITFTSLVMILYTKESPSWLIAKGRYEEAAEVFYYMRGKGTRQEDELDKMMTAQRMITTVNNKDENLPFTIKVRNYFIYLRQCFKKPEFYKPIIIMVVVYFVFQLAGLNVISSYAMDIIRQVVGPEANVRVLMIALDVERLICNILAVYVMRNYNRRIVLFSSGTICVLSYFGKAMYVYAKQEGYITSDSQVVPIALIAIYMFSLTIGISTMPFAISGEIFPLEYRGLAGGLSVLSLSINFFVAVKCFPVLTEAVGLPMTYIIYGGLVLLCLVFLFFTLPETKGKTLQEIEDNLRGVTRSDTKASETLHQSEAQVEKQTQESSLSLDEEQLEPLNKETLQP